MGPEGLDRCYLRIKMAVDASQPLKARFWYARQNGEHSWVRMKYKRLPEFYYGCGRIGHTEKKCSGEVMQAEKDPIEPMYRPWIQADRPRKRELGCRFMGKGKKAAEETKMQSWSELMAMKAEQEVAMVSMWRPRNVSPTRSGDEKGILR